MRWRCCYNAWTTPHNKEASAPVSQCPGGDPELRSQVSRHLGQEGTGRIWEMPETLALHRESGESSGQGGLESQRTRRSWGAEVCPRVCTP